MSNREPSSIFFFKSIQEILAYYIGAEWKVLSYCYINLKFLLKIEFVDFGYFGSDFLLLQLKVFEDFSQLETLNMLSYNVRCSLWRLSKDKKPF